MSYTEDNGWTTLDKYSRRNLARWHLRNFLVKLGIKAAQHRAKYYGWSHDDDDDNTLVEEFYVKD